MSLATENQSMATIISRVGMVGCAYLGYRFFQSCVTGREDDRFTDGVVFGTKVYLKAATGATAVLAGAKLWQLLPRVVPTGVVLLLTPIPFAIHALKCKETIFTTLRNTEYGMLPLAGFALFGYSTGRLITLVTKLGLTRPMVLATYSVLFGHVIALNTGKSVLEVLLTCAPASICITSALAPSVIGLEKFAKTGEILIQGQVLLSTLLTAHTWWSIELGNPLQFDVNNHAVLITGCGLYTCWTLVRVFFRVTGRTITRVKGFEFLKPDAKKKNFLVTNLSNIITTAVFAGGLVLLEPLLGRILVKENGIACRIG